MSKKQRILIVGAGLAGATVARTLADSDQEFIIDVIDSRPHIAGNAYDEVDAVTGITYHKYGPHLFHTNMEHVFDFLSRFTKWNEYRHKVKALLKDGSFVTLPVNAATKLKVGEENVLDIFFRPYTKKMWGVELDQLNPDIINRVPIRDDDNELYFPNDKYQALPADGYTEMVRKMLDHPSIMVFLNNKFKKDSEEDYDYIFNSMPIDVYYDHQFGELPYRSIKFNKRAIVREHLKVGPKDAQEKLTHGLPTATVNFTCDGPSTRVTEWSKLPGHGYNPDRTLLTFEEPCDYKDNDMERYYPVKDLEGTNQAIYKKYLQLKHPKMTFIGRCGLYTYMDMDMAVSSSIKIAESYLKQHGES